MGQTEQAASEILVSVFGSGTARPLRQLAPELIADARIRPQIETVYRKLRGVLPSVPIPGARSKWDVVTERFIIEIDEDAHFNRYRGETLDSPLYDGMRHFPRSLYRQICIERECKCRHYGKYWTSPSTARQFGYPDPEGNFGENGSPRWKQRAFYDFLKDATVIVTGVPVIRVSIWEVLQLKGKPTLLGKALAVRTPETDSALRALVAARASRFAMDA
jgi:hypothetical protein